MHVALTHMHVILWVGHAPLTRLTCTSSGELETLFNTDRTPAPLTRLVRWYLHRHMSHIAMLSSCCELDRRIVVLSSCYHPLLSWIRSFNTALWLEVDFDRRIVMLSSSWVLTRSWVGQTHRHAIIILWLEVSWTDTSSMTPCGKQHLRDLPTPDWASPLTKITYWRVFMTLR